MQEKLNYFIKDTLLTSGWELSFKTLNMAELTRLEALIAEVKLSQSKRDVHTEHCCVDHGCKYNSDDCTVVYGLKVQSYPCEECQYDEV